MKSWPAADAKRHFARVLQESATLPQLVSLRGKPVSVVVSWESYQNARKIVGDKSLSLWLEELNLLHELEGDLDEPIRADRSDGFGEGWT